MKVAAEMWHALSDTEKNNFKKFANDDRVLKQKPPKPIPSSVPSSSDDNKSLVMIFSDQSATPMPSDLSLRTEDFFDYEKYYKD